MSRAAPSLNPIQLGLPASVLVGLLLMGTLTGQLLGPLRANLEAAFELSTGWLG
jgi:flagellar biosynthetic protein FliR